VSLDLSCGIDEAGRGPLAGPVFAACVILNPDWPIDGIADSKQLSASRRESLAQLIRERSMAWSVASSSVDEIDRLNILQATLLAMRRAFEGLSLAPMLALVDGNQDPCLSVPTRLIIKGDQTEPAISAASILAKTTRDALMLGLHAQFPQYGFDRHMGYPTTEHLRAIRDLGVTVHHRRSFAPVKARISQ
jgi:ribonuclease HII